VEKTNLATTKEGYPCVDILFRLLDLQ